MAVLTFTVIRVHPEDTMDYILNPNKIMPGDCLDVCRAINYMGDENSIERVYSFGHNCSPNPVLCQQQFELYRKRYLDHKNGAGIQGCTDSKQEVLALHFFLSYDKQDPITEEKMNYISHKLDEYIGDFPVLSANHWDKDHKHTHKLVGQYSVSGTPRKFAMKHKDLAEMRKFVNRLCYEQGLSIIDLPELRKYDEEYSNWLDCVIMEGEVPVYPANGTGRYYTGRSHLAQYYQWLEAQKRMNEEEERLLTAAQLRKKKAEEKYFFLIQGRAFRRSDDRRYYSVGKYDKYGRKRTTIELLCMLVYTICTKEKEQCVVPKTIVATTDWKVQGLVDSVEMSRKYRVNTPAEVESIIKSVGEQMNALKIEKAKHDSRLESYGPLHDAIETFLNVRPTPDSTEAQRKRFKEIRDGAYSIMAAHKCTTAEKMCEFQARYKFSAKKSAEYEVRLKELKKDYRKLKHMQAVIDNPYKPITAAYELSAKYAPNRKADLADQIEVAEARRESPKPTVERQSREHRD